MTKKWHQIVARGRVMTEEVYAENEQVRCKASRSEKRAEGEILDRKALAVHLRSALESYKVPLLYESVNTIERTFNGKINRKY